MTNSKNNAKGRLKYPICINPTDEKIEYQLKAIRVINNFKSLGFQDWKAFYEVVKSEIPEADNVEMYKKIQAFWHCRNFSPELINKLECVFDKIKME